MSIEVGELRRWASTLADDSTVSIDEGGLTLIEIAKDGKPTGAYWEVGGCLWEYVGESCNAVVDTVGGCLWTGHGQDRESYSDDQDREGYTCV